MTAADVLSRLAAGAARGIAVASVALAAVRAATTGVESASGDRRAGAVARRRALGHIGLALGALAGAAVGVPVLGFVLSPLRRRFREVWRPVGRVDDFPIDGTTKVTYLDPSPLPWAGFAGETAAWLRREADGVFVAFTVYCTHTGCPVTWREGAQLFFCPCHGGAFHRDGTVAAGPPPAPLTRYPVRVRAGRVEIRTTPIPGRDL
jgi:menaquinol-cytochrome c reductase iron-sulfur subunit